jgi:hypothetical protein
MSTGNFNIPVTWLQADALDASQIAQVARDIKAVGQLRALTEAQSFFMASNNTLCQIDNYVSTNEASGYATFTVKAGTGRTAYFRLGMLVDIVADSSGPQFGTAVDGSDMKNIVTGASGVATTRSNRLHLIVSDVDYIGGTIKIATVKGGSMAAAALAGSGFADDDWVVLRGCGYATYREMRSWGLNDWIAESGKIMDENLGIGNPADAAIDLDTYSQFKSQVVASVGLLTENVMNGYVGGFLDAYPGQTLDTIITTMGVTLKYLEQPSTSGQHRLHWERTSKPLTYASGWDEVTYSFNGRRMNWIISPMCIDGHLYALKMRDGNIKRYVPPRVGGSDSRVGSEIEFLAPLGGHSNIFKIAHASTGASQAILEAPFWQYCLIAPVDVRGVKLTGLTEATLTA